MNTLQCTRRQSLNVETKNTARKAGSAIGAVIGGAGGIAGAVRGARVGLMVGAVAGPAGSVAGSIAGALLGGVVGMAVGCEVGGGVGGMVDQHILDNYVCLDCGHAFAHNAPIEHTEPESAPISVWRAARNAATANSDVTSPVP